MRIKVIVANDFFLLVMRFDFGSCRGDLSLMLLFLLFTEDEQFNDEKTYLIKQIKELQPMEGTAASSSAQMDIPSI